MHQYYCVQIPPNVSVQAGTPAAAANYLGEVLNKYAAEGWEFYSIETIGVIEHPGCGCGCLMFLATLLNLNKPTHTETYVIVFRRQV
ncbi:MAG: DUF4177 domain-containing protein [Armatimonadetes bacterium]|nr:DUF4177 domain-containing protein [Armatimonadota bacterium]